VLAAFHKKLLLEVKLIKVNHWQNI